MTAPFQPSLLDFRPPESSPRAAPGVKRAAKAGARGVDAALLVLAPSWVGRPVLVREMHRAVERHAGIECREDTVRRRLEDLERQGFVALRDERPLGHMHVEWVKA